MRQGQRRGTGLLIGSNLDSSFHAAAAVALERAARATEGDWSQYSGVCRVTVAVEVVREIAVVDTVVDIVTLVWVENIVFGMSVGMLPVYFVMIEAVVDVGLEVLGEFARHQ